MTDTSYKLDLIVSTRNHRNRVFCYIDKIRGSLKNRGIFHDATKDSGIELEEYSKALPKFKTAEYGSDEYKAICDDEGFKKAFKHHCDCNRHHLEHFDGDISKMSLVDVIEMVCDWQAAFDRDIKRDGIQGFEVRTKRKKRAREILKRFNVCEQLQEIIINTIEDLTQ